MQPLFQPIDIASVVFFRLVFGLLGCLNVLSIWIYRHLYQHAFEPQAFHFSYYGFAWVKPLSEPFFSLYMGLVMAAAVGIVCGKWYRLSCVFFALGYTYLFLLEKAFYLNHGYLFVVVSGLMIFFPAHRRFSVDARRAPDLRVRYIPYWPLFLLRFLMAVVYIYGGVAKINPDWLQAMPLKLWLRQQADMPFLGGLWQQAWVAYFMAYGGLLHDLLIVPFLIHNRTRQYAIFVVLFFHTVNLTLFNIAIFPWLSIALSILFFPPDFPRQVGHWMQQRWPGVRGLGRGGIGEASEAESQRVLSYAPAVQKRIAALIVVFCLIQLLIPLRHHLLAGDVAWTEAGHRYSWRMMLRSKTGYGSFTVVLPETGARIKVNPSRHLTKTQQRKLYGHPDMILQFAHFLRDAYLKKGYKDVEVYAHIRVRLNGRPYRTFVDQNRDLAKVTWRPLKNLDWLMPFDDG